MKEILGELLGLDVSSMSTYEVICELAKRWDNL